MKSLRSASSSGDLAILKVSSPLKRSGGRVLACKVKELAAWPRHPATNEPDHGAQPTRPDIQEAQLNLPATKGKPEIHEKRLRPSAAMLNWEEQRAAWKCICDGL